jgi:hypothetical protein
LRVEELPRKEAKAVDSLALVYLGPVTENQNGVLVVNDLEELKVSSEYPRE